MQAQPFFSQAAHHIQPSAIRKLVPYTSQPGVISFAGGWPAAELFPVDNIANITQTIFQQEGGKVLQYGPTTGDPRLLDLIQQRLATQYGLQSGREQIAITSGGQQALFLLAMVLLNPGDTIAVEAPSYVGAIGVFEAFQANMVAIPMDEHGLQTAELARQLTNGLKIKLVYTVPDFQNPTGLTLSYQRRQELVALAEQYNFLILEDAPYADLRYEAQAVPPIFTLDPAGRTLYLGSFSKIFAPLRVGWMIGNPAIVQKASEAKQHNDLCTPALTQAIAYHFCQRGLLEPQIEKTRQLYQHKRDVMLAALDSQMPAGVEWTNPAGGMFVWVTLPEQLNADELFFKAIEAQVAYVIGSAFYPAGANTPRNVLRLNFVSPTAAQIQEGIARLAHVFQQAL